MDRKTQVFYEPKKQKATAALTEGLLAAGCWLLSVECVSVIIHKSMRDAPCKSMALCMLHPECCNADQRSNATRIHDTRAA